MKIKNNINTSKIHSEKTNTSKIDSINEAFFNRIEEILK